MAKGKKGFKTGEMTDVDGILADHKAKLAAGRVVEHFDYMLGRWVTVAAPAAGTASPVRASTPVGGPPHNPVISSRDRRARSEKAKQAGMNNGRKAKNRAKSQSPS